MAFVNAKCPKCGAVIQVDNKQETGFCLYCGEKINVQDAISQEQATESKNLDKYKELAASALRANDGRTLMKYVDKGLEIDPHDSQMWYYKCQAAFISSASTDLILECGNNAIKFAENKATAEEDIYNMYLSVAWEKLLNYDISKKRHVFDINPADDENANLEFFVSDLVEAVPDSIIEQFKTTQRNTLMLLGQEWRDKMVVPNADSDYFFNKYNEIYKKICLPEKYEPVYQHPNKEIEEARQQTNQHQHHSSPGDDGAPKGCLVAFFAAVIFMLLFWFCQ